MKIARVKKLNKFSQIPRQREKKLNPHANTPATVKMKEIRDF
jgi:hypothetical protein